LTLQAPTLLFGGAGAGDEPLAASGRLPHLPLRACHLVILWLVDCGLDACEW
jgi:hypothetical protein